MPEDTKKNQQKGKNEPKDQRRRRGRQHAAPTEKSSDKKPETPKVTVPEKPVYEPPPPEFYANLKRETDEILKITEEDSTKYKKKEIQSNWAKYEMPIESYDEIDEQENLGADYEALIQAPLSVGGHFQFKHEKSWDITTGPSPYDKYFDINMDTLTVALSTIPFYERNSIDTAFFNESDIQTMNHRATKFKQKYYNDKKYTTPELEAQDRVLNSLKSKPEDNASNETIEKIDNSNKLQSQYEDIKLEECEEEPMQVACNEDKKIETNDNIEPSTIRSEESMSKDLIKPAELCNQSKDTNNLKATEILENIEGIKTTESQNNKIVDNDFHDFIQNDVMKKNKVKEPEINKIPEVEIKPVDITPKESEPPKVPSPQIVPIKNQVIESPEDLEKWLDDFLDG